MQRCVGLPRVVVRDLGGDVVRDVRLGDSVREDGAEQAHYGAEGAGATHEVTVHCGERTSGEGEGGGAVVGEHGVGVLEEGDHDEPAVIIRTSEGQLRC